ncbi:protein lifeguard 2 [Orussus abietinus]|uniref:protein lifeguard 2 n=1 Tax=Orussus abietinus TaxID=222816 RepID=UPI000C716108|nr:protein lifeguard 2 [Orussus abietinus]
MDEQQNERYITIGPPQLPPLVRGQKIKSGPYTITVTDEMVRQRERENDELYRRWMEEQERQLAADNESDTYAGEFKRASVRRKFIRKVFFILCMQLLFTAIFIGLFVFIDEFQIFMIQHWYLWIIALLGFLISYCSISCSQKARRTSPCNIILLIILTISMSYLGAVASVRYTTEIVFLAAVMTAIVTLLITIVATCTSFDLTKHTGFLFIISMVLLAGIIVVSIVTYFTNIRLLQIGIALLGTLALALYLFFDIQVLMGGRKIELEPEEVVFATTQIYVDIVLLYQYILMFIGGVSE